MTDQKPGRVVETLYLTKGILTVVTPTDGRPVYTDVIFPTGQADVTRFLSDVLTELVAQCDERRVWADIGVTVRIREDLVEVSGDLPRGYGGTSAIGEAE